MKTLPVIPEVTKKEKSAMNVNAAAREVQTENRVDESEMKLQERIQVNL